MEKQGICTLGGQLGLCFLGFHKIPVEHLVEKVGIQGQELMKKNKISKNVVNLFVHVECLIDNFHCVIAFQMSNFDMFRREIGSKKIF